MKNFIIIIASFIFLLITFNSLSYSYVLKGPQLLELMCQKLGQEKKLEIFQQLQIYKNDNSDDIVILDETVKFVYPNKIRFEIKSNDIEKIYIEKNGAYLTVIDGKITSDSYDYYNQYIDLLLNHSRDWIEKRLLKRGIDILISSLGRFENKIAYVIGGKYPDESVSQLWLDQETFLPLRLILVNKLSLSFNESGNKEKNEAEDYEIEKFEFRYNLWKKHKNFFYPYQIDIFVNDILKTSINVKDVKIDPKISNNIFNIKDLKKKSPSLIINGDLKKDNTKDIDDIKDTMKNFQKIFE